jgi:hypothetical protein
MAKGLIKRCNQIQDLWPGTKRNLAISVFRVNQPTSSDCHFAWFLIWGIARTQSPTNKNCAFKWSTFETIVGVNWPEVQWDSLILEEPPSWSWLTSTPGKYAIIESILQNQWKSTNEMGWKFRKNLLVQKLSPWWGTTFPLCPSSPALRSGDTVTSDRIERCCYC